MLVDPSSINTFVDPDPADMADKQSSDQHTSVAPVETPWLKKFLRKARGQIDLPPKQNITPFSVQYSRYLKGRDVRVAVSQSDSDYSATAVGLQKQARGEAYAEGGLTKFYEPIPEYEGRHRWDPTAEWAPAEEKRLVRTVRFPSQQGSGLFANGLPARL